MRHDPLFVVDAVGRTVDERSQVMDLAGCSLAQTLLDAHQGLRVLVQPYLALRHHHNWVKQDLPVAVDEDTELLLRRLVTDRQAPPLVRLDDLVLEQAKPVVVLRAREQAAASIIIAKRSVGRHLGTHQRAKLTAKSRLIYELRSHRSVRERNVD